MSDLCFGHFKWWLLFFRQLRTRPSSVMDKWTFFLITHARPKEDIWVSFCRAGKMAVWCPFFFFKVEPPCDQTWWDSLVFSILSCFSYVVDAENTLVGPVGPFYHNFDRFYPQSAVFGIFWGRITGPVTKRVQLDTNMPIILEIVCKWFSFFLVPL